MTEQTYGYAIMIAGAALLIWSVVLLFRSNGLLAAGYKNEEFTIRGIPKTVIGQFAPGSN